MTSIYPVICTGKMEESRDFYVDVLGFSVNFEADWYLSLELHGYELALLDKTHPTIPEAYRNRAAAGMLLNIEIDDVDAVYETLVVHGPLEVEQDIRSEKFGQRHFIVADPNGILIDFITEIPPEGEFVEQFKN